MKQFVIIGIAVAILTISGFVVFGGQDDSSNDSEQVTESTTETVEAQPTNQQDSTDLLRHVDTNSQQYQDMKQYLPADQYDEYFIANMIHFSEGIEQLEAMAAKSANATLANGASQRSAEAKDKVAYYKQLQKDKGYPISYGDNMLYHGAMGADSAVYYAITSLEGLSGAEYEDELMAQVIEFRKNQATIAAVGLNLTNDADIKTNLNEILETNNQILDVITKES